MRDISIPLVSALYPMSALVLLGGFITGSVIALIVFGSVSFVTILICMWLGIIRIMPFVHLVERWFQVFFPKVASQISKNIEESFLCEESSERPVKGIYLFHPHGLFSLAHFFHIGTNMTSWPVRPIRGTTLAVLRYLPFGAETLDQLGFVSSDYTSMKDVVTGGESISVTLGGVPEMLECMPGKMRLVLSRRRGIFRIALETGTALVPVLVYGENELWEPLHTEWLDAIQATLLKFNMCIPIPTWRSLKNWVGLLEKPLRSPVQTVIGSPLVVEKAKGRVGDTAIIELRERYFAALRELYTKTRPANYAEELEIL